MRKKTLGLIAVCALVVITAAFAAAVKLGPASSSSAAAGPAAGSLAREALAYRYSGRESFGIPVPVAREKAARGREASREIVNGFAQQAYADLAFPHKTVAVAQLQGALAAMHRHNDDGDDDGRRRGRRWEEVGPFTLDVAREATQNNGLPTQWSGRLTAMVTDPKCDLHHCRLGRRARLSDRRPLRLVRLGRPPASGRRDELGRRGPRPAGGRDLRAVAGEHPRHL